MLFEKYGSFNKDIHVFQKLLLPYLDATKGPNAPLWAPRIQKELDVFGLHKVLDNLFLKIQKLVQFL